MISSRDPLFKTALLSPFKSCCLRSQVWDYEMVFQECASPEPSCLGPAPSAFLSELKHPLPQGTGWVPPTQAGRCVGLSHSAWVPRRPSFRVCFSSTSLSASWRNWKRQGQRRPLVGPYSRGHGRNKQGCRRIEKLK